jgi:hypothetical protein
MRPFRVGETPDHQELKNDLGQIALSEDEVAQAAIAEATDEDSRNVRDAKADLAEGVKDLAAAFVDGGFRPGRLDQAMDQFRDAWEDALNA